MAWILAIVVCVGLFVLGRALWRSWVRPWRDVEQLVDDVINARRPRTFLVDGNAAGQRIGVALEDVFLRQRDLTNRAREAYFAAEPSAEPAGAGFPSTIDIRPGAYESKLASMPVGCGSVVTLATPLTGAA